MKPQRSSAGFSLTAVIVFITVASMAMALAVPSYLTQARRELEEELIFRGEEYVRAILKYQRRYGIFPTSIDALIETDGIRFLRRPYIDPITGDEFRLITINPDGSVSGSSSLTESLMSTPFPSAAAGTMAPSSGMSDRPDAGGEPNVSGVDNPLGRGGQGQQQRAVPGPQQAGLTGSSAGISESQGADSAGSSLGQPTLAGGIIGVAPTNEAASLKVYGRGATYVQWEFIALAAFVPVPPAPPPSEN